MKILWLSLGLLRSLVIACLWCFVLDSAYPGFVEAQSFWNFMILLACALPTDLAIHVACQWKRYRCLWSASLLLVLLCGCGDDPGRAFDDRQDRCIDRQDDQIDKMALELRETALRLEILQARYDKFAACMQKQAQAYPQPYPPFIQVAPPAMQPPCLQTTQEPTPAESPPETSTDEDGE